MKINLFNPLFINKLARIDKINFMVLTAIWVFMVILVNPLGDFPMIDDWVYGLAVKSILEQGDFRLPSPASANVFAQAFWGALFCLPFGFSFTALRFSTLTLGLVGVLVTYALLREINATPKISLLGALLMVVNPIYFGLSHTFMTDVPFYAFWVLALYCLIYGLKRDTNFAVVMGILISYIALLIRQFGIILSLGFAVSYLVKKGFNSLGNIVQALSPVLIGLGIQIFYVKWLFTTGRTPPTQIQNPQYRGLIENLFNLSTNFLRYFFHNTLFTFIYIGLFIFPLLIIVLFDRYSRLTSQSQKKLLIFALAAFCVSVMGWLLLRYKRLMPLLCCHLDFNFGFGPLFHLRQPLEPFLRSLKFGSLWLFESSAIPLGIKAFWLFMTTIGVIGAAILLYCFGIIAVEIFKKKKPQKYLNSLVVSIVIIYLSLLLFSILMERYLLPVLPVFMVIILLATKQINELNFGNKMTAFLLLIILIYGSFSIGAIHDYLVRDRTMWQALQELIQKDGVSPSKINGGYEFSGWYSYTLNQPDKPNKRWWADDNEYIISSGSIAGYQALKRYPFQRWLTGSQGSIVVLHKINK